MLTVGLLLFMAVASAPVAAVPWSDQVKDAYGYLNWGADTGRVIPGISISKETLPWLEGMWRVWPETEVSLVRVGGGAVSRSRQWWIGEASEVEATESRLLVEMMVGLTHTAVQEYLISRYTVVQTLVVKPRGQDFGLALGHLCFVTTDDQGATFSTIDFIRHNVLFMLRAEGALQGELQAIAQTLDQALTRNVEELAFENLAQLPALTLFCPQHPEIAVGDQSPIVVAFRDSQQRPLRYLWSFENGGIDRDTDGRFVYIADTAGTHIIELAVINDLGLFGIGRTQISVREP